MSIGAFWQIRSRVARSSLASSLLRALVVVALCFAGFVVPKLANAAAPIVDCASIHAGAYGDEQRAAHASDDASCCLFHCIPAVASPVPPVAEPVRPSTRIRIGGSEPARGVTPAIIVPPPRA